MIKIGVLTYPLNNNYGCYLQSYALLHFLQKEGFDVEYIYRRHNYPSWKIYIKYAIKTIYNNIKSYQWATPIYNYEWQYMFKKGANMYPFFEKNITPHTKPIYTTRDLKRVCKRYNVIIIGSDQVWRSDFLSNVEDYFLGFIQNDSIVKIAYAASFGIEDPGYSVNQIKSFGNYIRMFKAVSVREETGKKIISEYGWKCTDCKVVVDPTLLLKKDDYLRIIGSPRRKPVVFGYILDNNAEKSNILKRASVAMATEAVNILQEVKNEDFKYPSVEEWLSYFSVARFVVTDSYHGAVFSIIFNIPFAVIINKERGSARFDTLLGMFDLIDRIVKDDNPIENILNSDIDWDDVNNNVCRESRSSCDFLINSIRGI